MSKPTFLHEEYIVCCSCNKLTPKDAAWETNEEDEYRCDSCETIEFREEMWRIMDEEIQTIFNF